MTRRARPTIATLAIVALAAVPVWATVGHAAAPDQRPSLGPVPIDTRLLASAAPATPADAASTARSVATSPATTVMDRTVDPTSASPGPSNPALPTTGATPIVIEIGDALTVSPAGSPSPRAAPPTVDATSITRPPDPSAAAAPAAAPAAPPAEPVPATDPTVAVPTTATALVPESANAPAPAPTQPAAVGNAPSAGRMVMPNPGPLSPNQIDRITLTATPTALRDLLTVKVAFLGPGNTVLDTSVFSIRFVGRVARTQSFDATVPNGTITLSISWSSVAAPISVDEVSVSVIGVAPPGNGV